MGISYGRKNLLFLFSSIMITFATMFTAQQIGVIMDKKELDAKILKQVEDENSRIKNENNRIREENRLLVETVINRGKTYQSIVDKSYVDIPIKTLSGLMPEDMDYALGVVAPALRGIGEHLLLAERTYGINGLVIAGIAMLESGNGNSLLAKKKNNLFGIGAYDGNAYVSALRFDSYGDSISYLAGLLSRKCGNGDTLKDINMWYASDPNWANKVVRRIERVVVANEGNMDNVIAVTNIIKERVEG